MNYEQYTEMLVQTKTPHIIKTCPNSTTIRANGKNWFFPNGDKIEPEYLNFIKQVKREVIENAEYLNLKKVEPQYFGFTKLYGEGYIYNALEIDIKGAYWVTAYREKLITESTFLKGLEVPKRVRLMAFGAAATLKDVFEFDGNEYTIKEPEFSDAGRNAFFHVAKIVADTMRRIMEPMPAQVILYWVDAIFIHSLYAPWVYKKLDEMGYEYTTKNIIKIYTKGGNGDQPDQIKCVVKTELNTNHFKYERKTFYNRKKILKKIVKM